MVTQKTHEKEYEDELSDHNRGSKPRDELPRAQEKAERQDHPERHEKHDRKQVSKWSNFGKHRVVLTRFGNEKPSDECAEGG